MLGDEEDHLIKFLILSVTDHHGAHVLFFVGLMVVAGPDEGFFVFFDFVLMIILETNLSQNSQGNVPLVFLLVNIAAGLSLGD